jgi:hypothetical protein
MKDEKRECATCRYSEMLSADPDGNATVKCELNERQLFFPVSDDCIHWEKSLDEK